MAVSIIPFKMPEPMEIPAHIDAQLREMEADEAVKKGMELLMGIEAAETMVYERIGAEGLLELGATAGNGAEELLTALAKEECYGRAPGEGNSPGGKALAENTAMLVMGKAESGETGLPVGLLNFLLDGAAEGNVGFLYALPLSGVDRRFLGALTLIRPAASGPLNHEQPNLSEAMRRLLSDLLDGP